MEYSNHGGGTASGSSSKVSFFYLPSAAGTSTTGATTGATVAAPPPPPAHHHEFRNYYQTLKPEGSASAAAVHPHDQVNFSNGDMERIKAKIMCHPQYSSLLAAYLDCQKVGAPQDVIDRLTVIGSRLDSRSSPHRRESSSDPELDQFMEAYCNMLVKYREELTRPIQEATDFLKRVESQLSSLTNGTTALLLSSDGKNEGAASSEDEQDQAASEGEADVQQGIDPRAEEKELKYQLLKKYSGYISSLRQEFSKKKKKGKLPKEARQKLLSWWELHYKWPYPSESEKIALAEATGLDQKQINNWFINQRKRHWKPSEDMQFFVMDGYHHPHNTANTTLFLDGHAQFAGSDGLYRLGS